MSDETKIYDEQGRMNVVAFAKRHQRRSMFKFKILLLILIGMVVTFEVDGDLLLDEDGSFTDYAFLWIGLFGVLAFVAFRCILWCFGRLEHWRKNRRTWHKR